MNISDFSKRQVGIVEIEIFIFLVFVCYKKGGRIFSQFLWISNSTEEKAEIWKLIYPNVYYLF